MSKIASTPPFLSSSFWQKLVHESREAFLVVVDDHCAMANPSFMGLCGVKVVAGQPLAEIIKAWRAKFPPAPVLEEYFQACRGDASFREVVELQLGSGQVIEARCSKTEDGGARVWVWSFLERQSATLAWVSHELKNPLNAVLGFSEILQDALPPESQEEVVRESLKGLHVGGKHLQSILTDLLDYSRAESGVMEAVPRWINLSSTLNELSVLFSARFKRSGVEFLVEQDFDPRQEVWLDGGRLIQVLSNLVSNSLRFTKRGWVALRVKKTADGWRFVVEDTGIGIPQEQLASIFQPYFQVSNQPAQDGSGLGLAICWSLAHAMGGTLAVESVLGRGSRFTVDFPHSKSRLAESEESLQPKCQQPLITILLADDEETNHLLIKAFLRGLNVRVLSAYDGLQALDLWKQFSPQAILMDLRMPGLGGTEAARRIRAADPRADLCLLAMSASLPASGDLVEGKELWSGYLEKPFGKQKFLKFLSNYFTFVDDSVKSP